MGAEAVAIDHLLSQVTGEDDLGSTTHTMSHVAQEVAMTMKIVTRETADIVTMKATTAEIGTGVNSPGDGENIRMIVLEEDRIMLLLMLIITIEARGRSI